MRCGFCFIDRCSRYMRQKFYEMHLIDDRCYVCCYVIWYALRLCE